MIQSLKQGIWYFPQTFMDAFELSIDAAAHPEMIAVAGGGGKTSLICTLQKEMKEKQILHAVTTTTHMEYKIDGSFLEEESLESFFRVYEREHTVWLGIPDKKDKMKGVSEHFLYQLNEHGVTLLMEADGSRRHPVKFPSQKEPVIPDRATNVITVYGLDCLHKRIGEVGFRIDLLTAFLGKSEEDFLEEEDLRKLAVSEEAGRKNVPDSAGYQVLLNKLDLYPNRDDIAIKQLAREIQKEAGCMVHLAEQSQRNNPFQIAEM